MMGLGKGNSFLKKVIYVRFLGCNFEFREIQVLSLLLSFSNLSTAATKLVITRQCMDSLGVYLEDHPMTRKWLITMVSKSPNWGYSPSK